MSRRVKNVRTVATTDKPTDNDVGLFVAQLESAKASERILACNQAAQILTADSYDSGVLMQPSIFSKIVALINDAEPTVTVAAIGAIRNALILSEQKVMSFITVQVAAKLTEIFKVFLSFPFTLLQPYSQILSFFLFLFLFCFYVSLVIVASFYLLLCSILHHKC